MSQHYNCTRYTLSCTLTRTLTRINRQGKQKIKFDKKRDSLVSDITHLLYKWLHIQNTKHLLSESKQSIQTIKQSVNVVNQLLLTYYKIFSLHFAVKLTNVH